MAKTYKGSLSLEWYNKQKAIMLKESDAATLQTDTPAPEMKWVNKDDALFYEYNAKEGKGIKPFWVDRNDIRVKEARPLILKKVYKTNLIDKPGTIAGTSQVINLIESESDDIDIKNMLIKGDNLLALNALIKMFNNKPEEEKAKCIFLDPPYNTGQAFESYDDNLAQSEWLTMMRDRLSLLYNLLRQDGVIFIQLDEKNIFHLRIILDEIFGKSNYVNLFTIKTSDPSGLKTVNPSPYDAAEYIIMYARNKSCYKYVTQYVECDYDTGYSKIITNINDSYEKWEIVNLNEYVAKKLGFNSIEDAKKKIGKLDFFSEVADFASRNASSIFQLTAIADDAGREIVEIRNTSKDSPGVVFHLKREKDDIFILNGRQIYFYSNKVREVDGKSVPTIQLTNIWTDIPYNGISNEGGVKFKESKKPEKLLKRVLEVANTSEGDLVIDIFGGSGTTFAVAQKMKREWIGIEIGAHADSHIIPRLANVLAGTDKSGITELTDWTGGGSFKYYHLGDSILSFNEEGNCDFNWTLGTKFIQESLLLSYDYDIVSGIKPINSSLFQFGNQPTIGIQKVGTKSRVAIATLIKPSDKQNLIPYDEIQELYKIIKKELTPEYINIFTNRGVEIASDSKQEDLEIIKVPNAIFAELER